MKNAVIDFGAVGDNTTNNDTAASNTIAWMNANNAPVYWPAGQYVFNNVLPTITGNGASLSGDGPTSTIFRHNSATGNTVTLSGNCYNVSIKGIGFDPVCHKSNGYEIYVTGNCIFPIIENCYFTYVYGGINAEYFSLMTVKDCNFLFAYTPSGCLRIGGTGVSGNLANGVVVDNCYFGMGGETGGTHHQSWSASTGYGSGDQVISNGLIWTCISAGTSGSVAPAPWSYVTSQDPWATGLIDGTAHWVVYSQTGMASIVIDSYCVSPTLTNCSLNAGDYGLIMQDSANTGTSFPTQLFSYNTYVNKVYDTGIWLKGGHIAQLTDTNSQDHIFGHGLVIDSGFKGDVTVKGGLFSDNGSNGIILNAGPTNTIISEVSCNSNSAQNVNVRNGISVSANASVFTIQNCICGTLNGGAIRQEYGISIGSSCTDFNISNNICIPNQTGGIFNGSNQSPTQICQNNIGINNTQSALTLTSSNISSSAAVSLVNNTAKDVTSITLPAGNYLAWGNVVFLSNTGNSSFAQGWISTQSATQPDASLYAQTVSIGSSNHTGMAVTMVPISLTMTTTVYLSAIAGVSPALSVCGNLYVVSI